MELKTHITTLIARGFDSPSALIDQLRNGTRRWNVPTNNNKFVDLLVSIGFKVTRVGRTEKVS